MTEKEDLAKKLKKYDRDRSSQATVRDDRIPDLTFARWSQTEDDMTEATTTQFVGEFNIIGRERKNIQAEFRQNEVEVKFRSIKTDNDELDESTVLLFQGQKKEELLREIQLTTFFYHPHLLLPLPLTFSSSDASVDGSLFWIAPINVVYN